MTNNEINKIAMTMATETNGNSFGEILEIWREIVLATADQDDWSKIVLAFTKKWKECN